MKSYKITLKGKVSMLVLAVAASMLVISILTVWSSVTSRPPAPSPSPSPVVSKEPILPSHLVVPDPPSQSETPPMTESVPTEPTLPLDSPPTTGQPTGAVTPDTTPSFGVVPTPATPTPPVPSARASVLFDTGKSVLKLAEKSALNDFLSAAGDSYPDLIIVIEGHASPLETDAADKAPDLALARAKAISEYLQAQGVPFDRILPVGSRDRNADPDQMSVWQRADLYYIESHNK